MVAPARTELLAPLEAALDQLVAAAQGGALRTLDDTRLTEFVAGFERLRSRLSLVDHQIVTAVESSGLAERTGSTAGGLVAAARISRAEAFRRVAAAETVGVRATASGLSQPARHPRCGAAVATGRVPIEVTEVAVRSLRRWQRRFFATDDQLSFADEQLAHAATRFGPEEFRRVAQQVEDVLFPDGLLADQEQVQDDRQLNLTPKADGSWIVEGRLTGECGAALSTVLTSMSAPVPNGPDGRDHRTAGQRRHDGLRTALRMLLRAGGLPQTGGVPASIIVTIDHDDLLRRTGHGTTADGQPMTVAEVLRLAEEAELLPTVLSRTGSVLSQGRSRRLATESQTKALIARDGGCSFPHCHAPPAHCDRHHVIAWRDLGTTDVTNLTLLCGYHHARFEQLGWSCRMIDGLPHWIPPWTVDPLQTPILHDRIRARLRAVELW